MGSKFEILAFSAQLPRLDLAYRPLGTEQVARSTAEQVFPGRIGAAKGTVSLIQACAGVPNTICAGTFGETSLIVGTDVTDLVDLPGSTAVVAGGRSTTRLMSSSIVDAVALEAWAAGGAVIRELLLTPAAGVVIDEGTQSHFEAPFWAGEYGSDCDLEAELPFKLSDFGAEALRTYFGFAIGGPPHSDDIPADQIMVYAFTLAPQQAGATLLGVADPTELASEDTTAHPRIGDRATAAETEPRAPGWWRRLLATFLGQR
ncbi:hypothetical protein EH165_04630 [Nakamurella antarctica]|uniref:Uncharacterized protein n=1 Tax=Nakamurella antarctica TaxID=1902245 RepID=A0A3G8ZV16_9ACTN|nr:hypothetical protein [Nakamurella antarctica]AZI57551.1 hypothetical protein EH165_04630 [Nakamurella antarctica]